MPRRKTKKSPKRHARDIRRAKLHRARSLPAADVPPGPATVADSPSPSPAGFPSSVCTPPTPVSASEKRLSRWTAFRRWLHPRSSKVHPTAQPALIPPQPSLVKCDAASQTGPSDSMSDPGGLYPLLEDAMQLARFEDPKVLTVALRHLVRTLHPNGDRICFPVPELQDRLVLVSSGLPDDQYELLGLAFRTLRRRGQPFDLDSAYKDLVMAHGRVSMDFRKPWPECYSISKLP